MIRESDLMKLLFYTTVHSIRRLAKKLDIATICISGTECYTSLDAARIKAGIKYKDYVFVEAIERPWIFYGLSEEKEITVEI
jgi:two-component SAPR family response regulator